MKKSILGMMSMLALAASAQIIDGEKVVNSNDLYEIQKARAAASSAESEWLNYASRIQTLEYGNTTPPANEFIARGTYTAPDSVMIYAEDNSVWRHALAEMIDPSNEDWDYLSPEHNAYTVDSIAIDYVYTRVATDASVDTVEIVLLKDVSAVGSLIWPGNSQLQVPYVANADLSMYGGIDPTYVNEVIKVPLTDADTTEGNSINSMRLAFAATHSYSAGDVLTASIRFIPGYTYATGDVLFDHNHFGLISIKENASETIGAAYSDSLNNNKSMILDRNARYQTYPAAQDFLNQTFVVDDRPAIAQHHSVSFKVSTPNFSVVDFDAIEVSMFPNPTNGEVNIKSSLENNNVRVFNMLGKEVLNTVNSGDFKIDLTGEKAGIYFVTVKNELGTATSKVVLN